MTRRTLTPECLEVFTNYGTQFLRIDLVDLDERKSWYPFSIPRDLLKVVLGQGP